MIEILEITKNPLQVIGKNAGICWGATDTPEANRKRALSCIASHHDRVMEYPEVTLVVEGYSARCIRELYTHIVGTTRLQESTRYVDCKCVGYFTPYGYDEEQTALYKKVMEEAFNNYAALLDAGISREDAANALPLGMNTKIVWKINLRALVHFFHMRSCMRAYKEIRNLCKELKDVLRKVDAEWETICNMLFVPKCDAFHECTEAHPCPKGFVLQKKTNECE